MNDFEILDTIKKELATIDKPPLHPSVVKLYRKLASRVPEEGFEQIVADKDISDAEEKALKTLNSLEYIALDLKHHAGDGYYYHVNMRGKRFFEVANCLVRSVVVGMQDSGKREVFESGAVRDTAEGKPSPELISPFAMERLAHWLRAGAEKYAPRNWEKGIPLSRCTASLCRHLLKFQQGCTDEDHIAAILCNAMFIAHIQEMCKRGVLPESLLDMPNYNGDKPLAT